MPNLQEIVRSKNKKSYDNKNILNTIGFKLDASLDIEFPDRKYAIMVDLTPDTKTGKPAFAQFTFKNGEFIQNQIKGVKYTACAA